MIIGMCMEEIGIDIKNFADSSRQDYSSGFFFHAQHPNQVLGLGKVVITTLYPLFCSSHQKADLLSVALPPKSLPYLY
jgi:hypothetical protein